MLLVIRAGGAFSAPLPVRLPRLGFRNAGYGRSVLYRRVRVHARVIDLREEELRLLLPGVTAQKFGSGEVIVRDAPQPINA